MGNTNLHDQTELIQNVATLLEQLQNGKDVFSQLYDCTAAYIVMMIQNSKVSEADQEDLLQEIYCSIYTSVSRLEHCQAGLAWVKRIANNKIVDYCRKKYKEEAHLVYHHSKNEENDDEEFENNLFEVPEDVVDNKETQRLVRDILKTLSADQEKILFSYYFGNMKISQIAEMMALKENTVKTNLRRAKLAFKEQVEQLQKRTGIVLRLVPIGVVLYAIFANQESVQAAVRSGKERIETAVKHLRESSTDGETSNPSLETEKFAAGHAMRTRAILGTLAAVIAVGGAAGMIYWQFLHQKPAPVEETVTEATQETQKTEDTQGIETQETQEITAQEAFEQYMQAKESIQGDTYHVGIVKKTWEGATDNDYIIDQTQDAFPVGNLGYCIRDFDQDGDLELLSIDAEGNQNADGSECPVATMYEYENGVVTASDAVTCGRIDTRANDMLDNWLVYGEESYILQECYLGLSAVYDGYSRSFQCYQYDGNGFQEKYKEQYDGSDLDDKNYEAVIKKFCEELGIVEKSKVSLEDKPCFSHYIKNKQFIAQVIAKTDVSWQEISDQRELLENGTIDRFDVAEGVVKQEQWEDYIEYWEEKLREERKERESLPPIPEPEY